MNSDNALPEQEIFESLLELCTSKGYAHAIAYFCFRDNTISYDPDGLKIDDFTRLFSSDRLVRTELTTIVGLMLRATVNLDYPGVQVVQEYIDETEKLLNELHHSLVTPMINGLAPSGKNSNPDATSINAETMREPIFYGGESAHNFQFRDLAVKRFEKDDEWILNNKGFSIVQARDVVCSIQNFQNQKLMETFESLHKTSPEEWSILNAYKFTATDISTLCDLDEEIVTNILDAFSIPLENTNVNFGTLNDFNLVTAFPILKTLDGIYILFSGYCLTQALYESPTFWYGSDPTYLDQAVVNRGEYTERIASQMLSNVFGKDRVFLNVKLMQSRKVTRGEIDVLVRFADRLLVVQAKSKRLTIAARKGNDQILKHDFKHAVQDAYDQGISCAETLVDGNCKLIDSQSNEIELPKGIKEIHIICLIADHYPALSIQAREFLVARETDTIKAPFVMDVFLLDVMTEFLNTPLYFLSYIERRTGYTDKVIAAHEITVLSYHLSKNLWIDESTSTILIGDDISTELDIAMLVRREGMPGNDTPEGILTKFQHTPVGLIVREIERIENPSAVDFGFLLLQLNEETIGDINIAVSHITKLCRGDGQNHDFVLQIENDGPVLVIHSNFDREDAAKRRLLTHCEYRKYSQKSNECFGLCLSPENANLRFVVHISSPWVQSDRLDRATSNLPKGQRKLNLKTKTRKTPKIGRNSPCICGSGKKYKNCCLR